jgi:hypothetical protein
MVTRSLASLRTDNCPQPKEAQPLSQLDIRSIYHLDSSALWSDGPEVALNWVLPYITHARSRVSSVFFFFCNASDETLRSIWGRSERSLQRERTSLRKSSFLHGAVRLAACAWRHASLAPSPHPTCAHTCCGKAHSSTDGKSIQQFSLGLGRSAGRLSLPSFVQRTSGRRGADPVSTWASAGAFSTRAESLNTRRPRRTRACAPS